MIVTGIYKRKKNYEIYLDNEFAFTLTDEGLYRAQLSVGMEFHPNETINEILAEDEVNRCKNRALWIISATPKSVNMIRKKLSSEGFSDQAIEKTLLFMEEYSFVDDEELARSIIRSGNSKKNSTRQIQQKLFEKGIDKENAESILSEFDLDEEGKAFEIALKKYLRVKGKTKEEQLKKIRYALSYKGFSYEAIRFAINKITEIINDTDEAEE